MLIVRLYRDHADIVFIRNYRHCSTSSPLIERSCPLPIRQPLYLSNLFAHHEHHPSGDLPLSLRAFLSSGLFFYYFLFPYTTGLIISRLVGLISWHPIAERRLDSPRIRARGSSTSTDSEAPFISQTAPGMRFQLRAESRLSTYSRYKFPSVVYSSPIVSSTPANPRTSEFPDFS